MKNKFNNLSFITKILIYICVGIVLAGGSGIIIGGIETSWEFGNKSVSPYKHDDLTTPLTKALIEKYINNYLKNNNTWYYEKATQIIVFTIYTITPPIDGGARYWTIGLEPKPRPTNKGNVVLTLSWFLKKEMNDNDITKEIIKFGYSNSLNY